MGMSRQTIEVVRKRSTAYGVQTNSKVVYTCWILKETHSRETARPIGYLDLHIACVTGVYLLRPLGGQLLWGEEQLCI
jgi:hypothetical protein